jgi:hypothetical protein
LNRQFSKEVQMANKCMKKCSSSLAIKEIQVKAMLRFYIITVRMILIMKTINTGADAGKKEHLHTVGGNINECSYYENSMEVPQKNKNRIAKYPAIVCCSSYCSGWCCMQIYCRTDSRLHSL